jgi:hypothetical protein
VKTCAANVDELALRRIGTLDCHDSRARDQRERQKQNKNRDHQHR